MYKQKNNKNKYIYCTGYIIDNSSIDTYRTRCWLCTMSGKRTQKKAQAKNLMKARLSKARATKAKQHKSKQTDLPKNFKLLDDGGKVTITNKNLQSIYSNAGSLFNSKFHYYNNTFNGKHQLDKIHKVYGTVQLTEKLLLDTNLNKLTDSTGEIHAPKSVASEEVFKNILVAV